MTDKRTKKDRLLAIVAAFQRATGKTEWTTIEVADWAVGNGLLPVPGMREPRERHVQWDELFSLVTGNCDW